MISPNLNIAPDSEKEFVELGFDVGGKYYTVSKTETIIKKGEMHLEATKRMVLTIPQTEKLRDDLNHFLATMRNANDD